MDAQADISARLELLRRAVALRPASAPLLFQLAETLAAHGEPEEFARVFRQAFLIAPSVRPRLDSEGVEPLAERALRLRRDAQALLAHGISYAPVIAALAVAQSLLGHAHEAAQLLDYESFFRCETLLPDDAAFRDALAAELRVGAVPRGKRGGMAGAGRYTFDVLNAETPACNRLAGALREHVERYIAALPQHADHPFVTSRPARYALRGWSVASSADDHFESHIHPQAWLSGVYYVAQPEDARGTQRGSLHVGPPAQFGVTVQQGWAERAIEPVPGRLVLMPGYFYHATRPTLSDETRLCVAFNVVPEELDDDGQER
jgi:uncharacterized protein (TIGR02466 family)